MKTRFPAVPVIGFPRLAGLMVGAYARETQMQAVGIDTVADLAAVSALIPPSVALQGNLDPLALLAGGQAMECAATRILGAMRGRPFVFNLGHGVVPETPPENVASLVKLIRAA
jgi:uroporphyrinogen decarboxylase